MAVEMTPLASSNLTSAGRDPQTGIVYVEFQSGETYRYFNVPPEVYERLTRVESPGKYFHQMIRNSYAYEKA